MAIKRPVVTHPWPIFLLWVRGLEKSLYTNVPGSEDGHSLMSKGIFPVKKATFLRTKSRKEGESNKQGLEGSPCWTRGAISVFLQASSL